MWKETINCRGGWVTEMEEDETEKTIEWNELVDRCFRGLGLSSVFHLDRIWGAENWFPEIQDPKNTRLDFF